MNNKLGSILPRVSKPGRYIGGEINSIKKDLAKVDLKVALAFPDVYEVGISNLGLQILYDILNRQDHIAAERVYAPWTDMEALLRDEEIPLYTLESYLPLKETDIVGFSFQYELAYTNALNMLDLGGIPLLTSERGESDPLVIAGGPSTFNPEPMADFIDAFFLGNGEEGVIDISEAYLKWRRSGEKRSKLLEELSEIEGVYVPSLFSYEFGPDDRIKTISSLKGEYQEVKRRVLTNLEDAPYPTRFVSPNVRPVHDRVPLEVARGCSRFCRFCQAGYIYLPVRERSPEKIREIGEKAVRETGIDEVALLSLSTGDYSCLGNLLPGMIKDYNSEHIKVSFPSLRVDTITPPVMEEMKKTGASGFTIAPEAGSQRLRDFINKGVTKEQILATAREMATAGCQAVKLYFMIGLPSETKDDLDEIITLSTEILKEGRRDGGSLRKITVNLSTFVPKAHTPFQWARQNSIEETREKLTYFKRNIKNRNISLKWQAPEMSILEGIFSRGDRRAGKAILSAFRDGARFDGWGEKLDYALWENAFREHNISIDSWLRHRDEAELLPWENVNVGVYRKFLLDEWENACSSLYTEDCRYGKCSVCGVCDHKVVRIESFKGTQAPSGRMKAPESSPLKTKLRVRYAKRESLRFLGHIDTMHLVTRLLRRTGLPLFFSEGFRPSPKIAFSSPIPLGTESLAEYFDVEIHGNVQPGQFLDRISSFLPPHFEVVEVRSVLPGTPSLTEAAETEVYHVALEGKRGLKNSLREHIVRFQEAASWPVVKKTKKGERTLELKTEIMALDLMDNGGIELMLSAKGGRRVKAENAIASIFNIPPGEAEEMKVLKVDTLFSAPEESKIKAA